MEDEKEIRAAFAYMGPKTQAGLTLVALAKGAGILVKFRDDEIQKLKDLGSAVHKVANDLAIERDALLLQVGNYREALEKIRRELIITGPDAKDAAEIYGITCAALALGSMKVELDCLAGCLCKKSGGSCTPERQCTRCGCFKLNNPYSGEDREE